MQLKKVTKQQMKDTKPPKKEATTPKKTSESTVDKTKSKSDVSVSQDNKSSKTQGTNKSASQTSISHFSSISTPEYREGWDRIFGTKGSKIGLASKVKRKDFELELLSIPVEDMDSKTQGFLQTLFKKYAKRQGIQTKAVDNLMGGSYSIVCRKNKKT